MAVSADDSFLSALDLRDDQYSTTDVDRDHHSADWGTTDRDAVLPDAVVWPESTADVSTVLAAANDHEIPVTPFAAGTGIEGNAVPTRGGISLDLTRMDAVLDVRPADLQVDVQPGVLGDAVDDAVAGHGLFFPPLPTSGDIATIGGMVATNASGKQTVKYGKVGDWVCELEAVLADGSVITAGTKATKTSSGYNLKDLLVGSEGTLAVVTRATLRLAGRPAQVRGGRLLFETLDDATTAISDVIQSGVDVAAIELIDALSARMVNEYIDTDLPDSPMVFVEFHANHGIDEEIAYFRSVVDQHNPTSVEMGAEDQLAALWEARKELAEATLAYDPALETVQSGDVAVPISRYPDLIQQIHTLAADADILVPTFGHAGDGNVHFDVLVDSTDDVEYERGVELYAAVVETAIELGGTATGEHGVGRGKRKFMRREHGDAGVAAMQAIKDALDPNGILNPDKVLPDPSCGERP